MWSPVAFKILVVFTVAIWEMARPETPKHAIHMPISVIFLAYLTIWEDY